MYQLLSGKTIKLRLARIWVKCGFSSTTTSTFYTFKIRRSACPLFTPGRIAEMDDRSATVDMSRKKLAGLCPFGEGELGPSNTMWAEPRSWITMLSFH